MKLISYDPLVKGLNTLPSQGSIHGFETRTGYQVYYSKLFLRVLLSFFLWYNK